MSNKLFYMALLLLLIPWGPAQTAAPSIILAVQVVGAPTGACTPMGQAGQDVSLAGFNTTALCNDFTTRIPNTVGTGLPSNWLDCNQDSSTSSVWYWGFPLFGGSGSQPPCSGHVAWNVADPVNGNTALQFTLSDSDLSAYGFGVSGMSTVNWNQSNPVPGPGEYPYAYYEWTFRNDNISSVGINNAFWSWVAPNAEALAGQSSYLVELDFTESGATYAATDSGGNRWGPSGRITYWLSALGAGVPTTSYHTWGALFTGNGSGNFSYCVYVDGSRKGCTQESYDATGENLQRRYLIAWLQAGGSGFGTSHQYIKSIKVLTCANWQQSSAAGMCPGSTLNSTGFYQ